MIYNKLRKRKKTYVFKQGKVILPALLTTVALVICVKTDHLSEGKPAAVLETCQIPSNYYSEEVFEKIKQESVEEIQKRVQEELNKKAEQVSKSYDLKMYTTTSVHLRSKPKKSSDSIMVVPPYQIVTAHITDKKDNWYSVSYGNNTGWIKSEYLKKYKKKSYIDIPLEYQYQDLVKDLIDLYGLDIDEYFIYGMMYTENRFSNEEESVAGAQGILQIVPVTWNTLYKSFCKEYPEWANTIVNDATDKRSNITLGIYYIKQIRDSYNCQSVSENASRILTTYNRGPGGARRYYNAYGTYSSHYSQEILRAAEYIRVNKTWKEGL